jgi:hypothetical protein
LTFWARRLLSINGADVAKIGLTPHATTRVALHFCTSQGMGRTSRFFIKFQDERFDRAAAATELRAKISKRVYKARRRKVHLRQPSCLNSSAFRTDVRSSKKQQPDDKTTRR